jgi:hypothetical protein
MRKVTATAVILTALTGCSQSGGIPSAQWSFKVPSSGEASSQLANADVDKEISARSGSAEKTELFAGSAGSSRMMGPAFEQPDAQALAKASTLGRPSSGEASNLSASLANGLAASQTSTRPDPVAQVRAYLNTSSPTALTNRTPYNSQVYLSSAPAANSSFVPSAPSVDYLSIAQLGLDSPATSNSNSSNSSGTFSTNALPEPAASNATNNATNSATYAPLPVAETLPSESNSSYVAVAPAAYSADYPSANVTSRSSDGLPQLASNVSSSLSSSTALPESIQTEAVQPEADSIGTAILRDLQRSSSAETAADITTSAPASAVADTANITAAPAQSLQPQLDSVVFDEAASVGVSPQVYAPSESAPSELAPSELAPSESSTYSEPATLVRLTQTMPDREASPLVDSFRAGSDLTELSQPVDNVPLSSQREPISPNSSRVEVDLRSSDASLLPASPLPASPLLEGLRIERESSQQSTIYVPIAEAAPVNGSDVLISGATFSLEEESSTSAFTDKLARSNVFSSVLSSPALLASVSAPSLNGFNVFSKPNLAELTLQQDKITLAAYQTSKRRQRLTWL